MSSQTVVDLSVDAPRPGDLIVARNRKWDGGPHWVVPGVHLKSLATVFAPDCDLRVRITARAATRTEAEALVARAAEHLAAELARLR